MGKGCFKNPGNYCQLRLWTVPQYKNISSRIFTTLLALSSDLYLICLPVAFPNFFLSNLATSRGVNKGGGGGNRPLQILAEQKVPPGSGSAQHYYLPPSFKKVLTPLTRIKPDLFCSSRRLTVTFSFLFPGLSKKSARKFNPNNQLNHFTLDTIDLSSTFDTN